MTIQQYIKTTDKTNANKKHNLTSTQVSILVRNKEFSIALLLNKEG